MVYELDGNSHLKPNYSFHPVFSYDLHMSFLASVPSILRGKYHHNKIKFSGGT